MANLCSLRSRASLLFLSIIFTTQTSNSQPLLGFSVVTSGFTQPVDVVPEPGSTRFFVVEQGGLIRIYNGTSILGTPFLDITSLLNLTGSERGLLSMAFHPGYTNPANRYFFVYYTNTAGAIEVARYRRDAVDPDIADPGSGVVLLTIPKSFANHNGGKLNFGPDGMLYFATGDGGSSNDPGDNAQDENSLLGKMIRLNVDDFATPPFYTVPPDNPFTGASPIDDAVFALGLRNPWRWSFDDNGDMWIADVGQDDWEEVNFLTQAVSNDGINYQWRCREGMHANPNIGACAPTGGISTAPIFEYIHDMTTGGFSITGGYVYRGTDPINAALVGRYVCADYISGNVWTVLPDGSSNRQSAVLANIAGFGESANGELYAVNRSNGTLYRVVVTGVLPVRLTHFSGDYYPGYNELKWSTGLEENTEKFVVEYSINGTDFLIAGTVGSSGNSNGSSYTFKHAINNNRRILYRLRIVDIDGSGRLSAIISLGDLADTDFKIYPSPVKNNLLHFITGPSVEKIEIVSMQGKLVYSKSMNSNSGYFNIELPVLVKGMYIVRVQGKEISRVEKIIID
jgi:hypothetical protein